MIIMILLCTAVILLAMAAFWPRHRRWLQPLLLVPWVGALVAQAVNPLYSSIIVIPIASTVLSPLLALAVDRWTSLRPSRIFGFVWRSAELCLATLSGLAQRASWA